MSKDLYAMALTAGQQSASMDGYLQAVSTIPMLDAEKEKQLATRLQEEGDLEAAKQLIMSHLRFVAYYILRYNT
jgi:RNA polymerase sigma-32 factor